MVTCVKSQRVIFPDGIRPGCLYMEGGKLVQIGGEAPYDQLMDFGEDYISPGFIDLHTHGAAGHSFIDCDAAGALEACRYHLSHGTTTLLPTISAAPLEEMGKAVGTDEHKNTFVRLFGLERCEEMVQHYTRMAVEALDAFEDHEFLKTLALQLTSRTK